MSEGAAYLANGEQDWKEEEEECLIGRWRMAGKWAKEEEAFLLFLSSAELLDEEERPIRSRLISHPLMYARMRRPQYDRALFILSSARAPAGDRNHFPMRGCTVHSWHGPVQVFLLLPLFSLPPPPHLISLFFVPFSPLPPSFVRPPVTLSLFEAAAGNALLIPIPRGKARKRSNKKKGGELLRCLIAVVGNC